MDDTCVRVVSNESRSFDVSSCSLLDIKNHINLTWWYRKINDLLFLMILFRRPWRSITSGLLLSLPASEVYCMINRTFAYIFTNLPILIRERIDEIGQLRRLSVSIEWRANVHLCFHPWDDGEPFPLNCVLSFQGSFDKTHPKSSGFHDPMIEDVSTIEKTPEKTNSIHALGRHTYQHIRFESRAMNKRTHNHFYLSVKRKATRKEVSITIDNIFYYSLKTYDPKPTRTSTH